METVIALAGNPNSGKTTLFNVLTGARQHVANYPGVTVEKKQGICIDKDRKFQIVDLPGTYSLTAYSLEEIVARDFLIHENPGLVINIVDASNLERNLYLTLQFMEMGIPVCIALNMMDVARKRGVEIDTRRLAEVLDVPVIPTVARSGKGKKELIEAAGIALQKPARAPLVISYGEDIDRTLLAMEPVIREAEFLTATYPARWVALKYLENDEQIRARGQKENAAVAARLEEMTAAVSAHLQATAGTYPEAVIADHRYGYIRSLIIQGVISRQAPRSRQFVSDRIDRVLTHTVAGPLILLLIIWSLYQFTFTFSEVPVAGFESFFGWLAGAADKILPDGLLKSLVISGIIEGVGGVLGFVPLILFMFFGIALLEDSGYLARVSFMLDRVFRVFGLHGSSIMAYMVSGGIAGGCGVPGIMATRTLRSPRERMATLLTVPFMNCGAKLPVFALLVAAFFARHKALMMFVITLISWTGALLVARVLRSTVIRGPATPFVMELPPYRLPTLKGMILHTWERAWQYLRKAGTVLLGISILLWALMTFPGLPDEAKNAFESERQAVLLAASPVVAEEAAAAGDGETPLSPAAREIQKKIQAIDSREAEAALRNSVVGRLGTALEGVSRLAGFDWRTNIALIGGFAAKEVVVSTLGTAYALGEVDPENSRPLAQTLARAPGWSPLKALAVIVFIIFYSPCLVAVVCLAREAGSWKWGLFSMVLNTVLAFMLATLIFQAGKALGL